MRTVPLNRSFGKCPINVKQSYLATIIPFNEEEEAVSSYY